MASSCPRCGSEILPGEVSTRPAPADEGSSADRLEVVRCLCCGADLSRVAGTEDWQSPT